jgi:hypothetical protein
VEAQIDRRCQENSALLRPNRVVVYHRFSTSYFFALRDWFLLQRDTHINSSAQGDLLCGDASINCVLDIFLKSIPRKKTILILLISTEVFCGPLGR